MKKIALDVDGVLLDFMPVFDRAAKIVLGKEVDIQKDENRMNHYYLDKRLGLDGDIETVNKVLNYMLEKGMYGELKALPGAVEAIERIQRAGFEIYNVTAVPEMAKEMRLSNLMNELNYRPKEIFCVGMGKSKKSILEELKPDVFVDDRIEYLSQADFVHHLVWIDQRESQSDIYSTVDCHAHSLLDWTKEYLPILSHDLDLYYEKKSPLQLKIKLENVKRKYVLSEV